MDKNQFEITNVQINIAPKLMEEIDVFRGLTHIVEKLQQTYREHGCLNPNHWLKNQATFSGNLWLYGYKLNAKVNKTKLYISVTKGG
jgi:hypothetical protein